MDISLTEKTLELFKHAKDPKIKTIISYGGSSSGKTYSILQFIIIYAIQQEKANPRVITIVGQTYTKLWDGVITDFKNILGEAFSNVGKMSGTSYTFNNKTVVKFKVGDDPQKFHGPRQHIIYYDEVNHIKNEDVWVQGNIRTDTLILASFNPKKKFFIVDDMAEDTTAVIHSTYKDNKFVSQTIIDALHARSKRDVNFRKVYMEGNWGTLDGNIFDEDKHFFVVDGIPDKFKSWEQKKLFAMDYGFDNDPTTLVELSFLKSPNDDEPSKLYIQEHFVGNKHTAAMMAPIIKKVNPLNIQTVIDSANTGEFVYTLVKDHNINIEKVHNKGGIAEGLLLMKEVDLLIDESAQHTIDEFRNLAWDRDKQGNAKDLPIPGDDHCIDAIRYGFITLRRLDQRKIRIIG